MTGTHHFDGSIKGARIHNRGRVTLAEALTALALLGIAATSVRDVVVEHADVSLAHPAAAQVTLSATR